MIGQTELISKLSALRANSAFPHFVIIIGASGSGKKTLIKELFGNSCIYPQDNSVASIRQIIDMAYKVNSQIFVLADVDDMSLAAKNALLKVVEEYPNNNSFIMTATDENNVLETIRSRAIIFNMEEYSYDDIVEYVQANHSSEMSAINIITDICDTPGEVDLLISCDVTAFYKYVDKVIDNIASVSGANAFKIAEKLSFKEGDGKYDLRLFLKTFIKCCVDRFKDSSNFDVVVYSKGCQITSKYIRDLRIKGINKQMLFDSWLLEIREAWR